MYECKVIISDEDVDRLLIKHGFVKDKRMWRIKGSKHKMNTQDALQAIVISAATRELERGPELELLQDYRNAVVKFDACRGCLAMVSQELGLSVAPKGKGEWHEKLIKNLDRYFSSHTEIKK